MAEDKRMISLTHANHKCDLVIYPSLVFGVWYSEAHHATLVMASGGGMVPVLETVEEVTDKLLVITNNKGETNE